MRLGIAAGPILLLLWQAAPIDTVRDSTGKVRVSLGFGGGQFEDRQFGCDGSLISARQVSYKTGGAQIDAWPNPHVRLSGFGGKLSSDEPTLRGVFTGAQVAWEGRSVGLGGGAMYAPLDGGNGAPSFYFRLGSNDRIHFRMDLFQPEPAFGTTGVGRLGIGRNQGLRSGTRWLAGVSVPLDADNHHVAGAFGELTLPAFRQLEVTGQAAIRSKEQFVDWGVSLGLRYNFGY